MKKKRFLKLLLVGGLMVASTIGLDSCKKSNEAADEDLNLPMTEIEVCGLRDPSMPDMDLGFICPYCGKLIPPGTTSHIHHFSPMAIEDPVTHCLPFLPTPNANGPFNYGIADSLDASGNIVYDSDGITPLHQLTGNRDKPFEVDYCETYWNLPPGGHVCPYCVEGRYHRHNIVYHIGTNGHDGYTHNQWHIGGGAD